MKKRVLLSLMLSLVAVLGCCFSFNSKNNVVFAAAAESVESYYLINNGTPYKANQSVGTASGYGQYKVGDENVSISASALNGYKLVGWQVTLTEENPNTNIYINDTNLVDNCKIYTFTTKENDNGETASVDAIITFADTNNDGCYDSGSMQLAEVFEDMIVEPVFYLLPSRNYQFCR